MPRFNHAFDPPAGTTLGSSIDLSTREIEDAGLRELLQSPGVGLRHWKFLDALLTPRSRYFVFREPLGHSREVKTAVSGLLGRFVARAYATRYLGYAFFDHIRRPPMRLSGLVRGEVHRVRGMRGDLPDWVGWGTSGLSIIEAKGCHDKVGPQLALSRAFLQACRAEIRVRKRLATFKRFAIATRWGVAPPSAMSPMLWVRDPETPGDGVPLEDALEVGIGVARNHYSALLGSLGLIELSDGLRRLSSARSSSERSQAISSAQSALARTLTRQIRIDKGKEPTDELVGGYVTRAGPIGTELLPTDRQVLSRLDMAPAFVGIERRILKATIEGNSSQMLLETKETSPVLPEPNVDIRRDDGAGGWVIRFDEDQARIINESMA